MPMGHDHREQLAHLVDEWGTLGVLSVLLDDLTEATAETVIEAYRMRRLRESPPVEPVDEDWKSRGRRLLQDEDGWLRIAEQEWFVGQRSPWTRQGWFWQTWRQDPMTIPETLKFRRDFGDPATFRIEVTGILYGRLEVLLDGTVVRVFATPIPATRPDSCAPGVALKVVHPMPSLNLGPHEVSLRLTGQTLGGPATPLTLAVSALPDVDRGPVAADGPDSQEWEWEGYR